MEEVDSIILHFLRRLDVSIEENTKSICELPVETIIESAIKCIGEINNSHKLPSKVPSGISHRIGVASQIASICKDLGYKNDVGYQTFLYYNEAELRQIFMFLIENLPNENNHIATNTSANNNRSPIFEQIGIKINEDLNSVWVPPCCNPSKKSAAEDFVYKTVSWNEMLKSNVINENDLLKKLYKISDNKSNDQLTTQTPVVCNETLKSIIEPDKSLKDFKELSIVLKQKLETLESQRNVMDVEYSQTQKACERLEAEMKNVTNILVGVGITDIESETVDNIIERVQNKINNLHKVSEELTYKNLSLKVEFDKIINEMESSMSERIKCKKILAALKENAKSLKEEFDKKEEVRNQIKKVYERSKGGNKRSIYTRRILEIISNVDKQNMEIKKILEDTRQIQKEINSLEGQLDRCFSIADETLFRDAKKDDQTKKAYKLLALLHSECGTIVSLVNDTGAMTRDIVDLEDNIKTEKSKRTEDNLKKIHLDLSKMQQEYSNSILI